RRHERSPFPAPSVSIFDLETGHRSALVLEEFKHFVQVDPLKRTERLRWSADEFALTSCRLNRLISGEQRANAGAVHVRRLGEVDHELLCPAVQEFLNPLTKMLSVVARKATPQVEHGDVVHFSHTKFES